MPQDREIQAMDAIEGQCLCGAVAVEMTPPQKHIDACHCGMCRKWAGGPHMGLAMVTDPVFTGEQHITRYASSEWAERAFCKTCGTHLYYYFVPQKSYSFPAGLFDGLEGYAMTMEIFADNKPDYYDFAGEHKRLTEAETMAMFTSAMASGDDAAEQAGD